MLEVRRKPIKTPYDAVVLSYKDLKELHEGLQALQDIIFDLLKVVGRLNDKSSK